MRYLVESSQIEKLTTNSMGKTALDILNESPPHTTDNNSGMERILISLSDQSLLESLPKLTDITMVVVVLIATMAFQAAVSPPGGVWQDNTSSHRAGQAVMASTHPKIYKHFVRANTTAFVSSLITIFLVSTGVPSKHILFLWIATYAMFVSLTSIAVSYGASLIMTNPRETQSLGHIVAIVVSVFISIYVLIMVYLSINNLYLSWKRKIRQHEDLTTAPLILRFFYHIFQTVGGVAGNSVRSIKTDFWVHGTLVGAARPQSPSGDTVQIESPFEDELIRRTEFPFEDELIYTKGGVSVRR